MIRFLFDFYQQGEQSKVIQSRWVIDPRSGVFKAQLIGKGLHSGHRQRGQVCSHTSGNDSQAHPHGGVRSTNGILQLSDVSSACLNTLLDQSKGLDCACRQAPQEIQHLDPTVWKLRRQLLWSSRFTKIMADSLDSGTSKDESCSNEVRSMFPRRWRFLR